MDTIKRTERDKLQTMAKERKSTRLVIGVNTPNEFREALRKAGRGDNEKGVLVRLEDRKRNALNDLASEAELSTVAFLRVLIDASVKLGIGGVKIFIDAANNLEDPEEKFRKSKHNSDEDPEGETSSESLSARLKRLSPDDPDKPERVDDQTDDDKKRKKKKKKRRLKGD